MRHVYKTAMAPNSALRRRVGADDRIPELQRLGLGDCARGKSPGTWTTQRAAIWVVVGRPDHRSCECDRYVGRLQHAEREPDDCRFERPIVYQRRRQRFRLKWRHAPGYSDRALQWRLVYKPGIGIEPAGCRSRECLLRLHRICCNRLGRGQRQAAGRHPVRIDILLVRGSCGRRDDEFDAVRCWIARY